jgi:hypothetical protein
LVAVGALLVATTYRRWNRADEQSAEPQAAPRSDDSPATATAAAVGTARPPASARQRQGPDSKVADLIDQLQEVSEEGVGSHATAWTGGFVAVDDECEFQGGIIGAAKPVTHPAMRALVRRGVAALPQLLEHLTDARPTKLVVGRGSPSLIIGYGTDYEPRDIDTISKGMNLSRGLPRDDPNSESYTIKVGDLCFVAVGQIVNRKLAVLRYQPSAMLFINSPVRVPALADAIRTDWSGITADQHRQSLVRDCAGKSRKAFGGLPRLLYYYPAAGEEIAVKALSADSLNSREGMYDQTAKVRSLTRIQSKAVDGAVLALLRAVGLAKFEGLDRVVADDLVLACMGRLAGGDLDGELAAYCDGRIGELQGRGREVAEDQRLQLLSNMRERLSLQK